MKLSGAYNFRDLGGMRTRGGGVLRCGRLFRSDSLQELTDDDVARLVDELQLAFVIDLRQAAEAVEEGRGPLARLPVCYANVPLVDLDSAGAPGELTATQYLDHLEHDPNLVVAVELVASVVHRPTVLHCAAGKDRTGVAVALLLRAAGVERTAVAADFAATNDHRVALRDRLAAQGDLPPTTDPARIGVTPAHLEPVLDMIDEDPHGPFRDAGVPQADLDAWRDRLVDPT